MERERFTPEINEELDIKLTAITDIKKSKKVVTVNDIVSAWVEEMTEKLTTQELAEYAASKKGDPQAQQWAREEIVRKIVGGKQ